MFFKMKKSFNIFIKTINVVFEINKYICYLLLLSSLFLGVAPIVSTLLSQRLINSLQLHKETFRDTILLFSAYIIFMMVYDMLGSLMQ